MWDNDYLSRSSVSPRYYFGGHIFQPRLDINVMTVMMQTALRNLIDHVEWTWCCGWHGRIISVKLMEAEGCSAVRWIAETVKKHIVVGKNDFKKQNFPWNNLVSQIVWHYQGCHVSGKFLGKTKFSPSQGKVREFWRIVREFWPFDSCQGILWYHVRELSGNFVIMTLFLDWNFHHSIPSIPSTWVLFMSMSIWQYKLKVYWLLLSNICFSKTLVCRGITINNS